MPKPLQYGSGSVIYFQGDPADKIFILQTGKVSLVYQDIETGVDVKDPVQPGEFFGVKSALGRYTREENAITLADTNVMVFTVPEFEAVATANSRIILKMLKVFSNQMRRVHKQVSKLMAKEEEQPDEGLFSIGEFYLKNKRYSHAKHVFSRYLTFYPSGKHAFQAANNLKNSEDALARFGNGKGPNITLSSGSASAAAPAAAPVSTGQKISLDDPSAAFAKARNLSMQGKYQEAFMSYKLIVDSNAGQEWVAKSALEIGRCMFMLGKFEDSIKYITNMLTQYPKHPRLAEAIYIMGQCNEKLGRKDQAAAFYKKIISMGTSDEVAAKAKQALGALGA